MRKTVTIGTLLMMSGSAVMADNLAGKNRLLCSAVEATVCTADGICEGGPPWDWQIPQFVVIDLDRKELSTTEASGENRTTPIRNLSRQDGHIELQGAQGGRTFSMVLNEVDGHATIAIATDGATISVFAACTPL